MVYAIIVAAGKGLRMKASTIRKQFLLLDGRPILAHTLQIFDRCPLVDRIILVVPGKEQDYCREHIIDPATPATPVKIVDGGARRQDSVFNGIEAVGRGQGRDIVVVHDGVRPFVSIETLTECIETADRHGACLVGVPVVDTLKRTDANGRVVQTLSRSYVWQAQTPQSFRLGILRRAHQRARLEKFMATDDAQLVERMGEAVHVIRGKGDNIKITTAADLLHAQAIVKARSPAV